MPWTDFHPCPLLQTAVLHHPDMLSHGDYSVESPLAALSPAGQIIFLSLSDINEFAEQPASPSTQYRHNINIMPTRLNPSVRCEVWGVWCFSLYFYSRVMCISGVSEVFCYKGFLESIIYIGPNFGAPLPPPLRLAWFPEISVRHGWHYLIAVVCVGCVYSNC